MKRTISIAFLFVASIFLVGFNLFNSPELINEINIDAKFVSGAELTTLDYLLGSPETKPINISEKDIYLIARCTPKGNPGKRILNLKVEIKQPLHLEGEKIELIPYGSGFLTRGSTYSLTKVISADAILPKNTRETTLKSKPEFRVIELSAK